MQMLPVLKGDTSAKHRPHWSLSRARWGAPGTLPRQEAPAAQFRKAGHFDGWRGTQSGGQPSTYSFGNGSHAQL